MGLFYSAPSLFTYNPCSPDIKNFLKSRATYTKYNDNLIADSLFKSHLIFLSIILERS